MFFCIKICSVQFSFLLLSRLGNENLSNLTGILENQQSMLPKIKRLPQVSDMVGIPPTLILWPLDHYGVFSLFFLVFHYFFIILAKAKIASIQKESLLQLEVANPSYWVEKFLLNDMLD